MRALIRWASGWVTVRVTGNSMTPTLRAGDTVLVRRGAPIRPGDVVLARFRAGFTDPVLKRAQARVENGWLLSSDNVRAGSDSRTYGVAEAEGRAYWVWRAEISGSRLGGRRHQRWFGGRVAQPPGDGL